MIILTLLILGEIIFSFASFGGPCSISLKKKLLMIRGLPYRCANINAIAAYKEYQHLLGYNKW